MKIIDSIPIWGEHEDKTLARFDLRGDCGSRGADGRRPSRLRRAHRRRRRLQGRDQPFRRRLRHRLRQQGRAPRHARRRTARENRSRSWTTSGRRSASASAARTTTRRARPLRRRPRRWDLRATRPLRQKAQKPARHHRLRQPLRRPLHRRTRSRLDRRALRFARLRPRRRDVVPKAAGAKDGMEVEPVRLSTPPASGRAVHSRHDARRRVRLCRPRLGLRPCRASLLGATIVESVHNHHNFAWREEHDGEQYWVVRKGATPAFPGQKGFVGGTMAEPAVILEGVDSEESKLAMYSTVHGAGRVMGRREATGNIDRKTGEVKRAPKVTPRR